jgi:PAS domain-containing protein
MFGFFKKKKEIKEAIDQIKGELDVKNLHIRQELYRLTKYFNKMPFLYSIIDYDGRIIKYNQYMDNHLLKPKLMGSKLSDFIHPNDVKDFEKFSKKIKNNSEKKEIFRLISKEGELSYVKWSGINLEEDQMILLIGQDITCEMEISDELKKFIDYKNLVLDNYPGSIVCTNLSGIITEFNKSAEISSGYEKINVLNKKHLIDLFPNKDIFCDSNIGNINKTDLKRKNGDKLKTYLLITPLMDNNKMEGYFCIWYDQSYINYIKNTI